MKKVLIICLFFITFFIRLDNVEALSCAEIDKKIDSYNHYQEQLESVDCTNNNDEKIVATCNDSNMGKNAIVIELMRLNDNDSICDSKKAEVNAIIEENKDKCNKVLDETFTDFVNKVLLLFDIIGPILLIVFGTLDYAKAVVSQDQELVRTANKRFFSRLIATVLLILAPILTNLILSFNTSEYELSGNSYSCNYTYTAYFKKWNIVYKPKQKKKKSSSSSSFNTVELTDGELAWPFPGHYTITSGFGPRSCRGCSSNHKGIDIGANGAEGLPAVAAGDGTVKVVQNAITSARGRYVVVSHGSYDTLYQHLASTTVSEGDSVSKGDQVGVVGGSGNYSNCPYQGSGDHCYANHLHFEVHVGGFTANNANTTDPANYLGYPSVCGSCSKDISSYIKK